MTSPALPPVAVPRARPTRYQSSGSSNITVTSGGGGGTTPPPTTPPPTTPPPSGSGCSATFTNSSDWGSGFTGSVAVKNNGSAAINGSLGAGAATSFGFNANYPGSNGAPTATCTTG